MKNASPESNRARREASRAGLRPGLLVVAAALLLAPVVSAQEEPQEHRGFLAAKGRTSYRVYCASCHGEHAKGQGNIAQYLTVPPADLTRIRQRYGGEFPSELIHQIIDGRQDVRGHGGKEMPVWGDVFQSPLAESGPTSQETGEERAARKIKELVMYLESIQIDDESSEGESQ